MKIILSENQFKKVVEEMDNLLQEQVVQGISKDPYQYKKVGNSYFFAKKGKNPIWKQSKNPTGVEAIKKMFIVKKQKAPIKKQKKTVNKNNGSWTDVAKTVLYSLNPSLYGIDIIVKGFKSWARRTFPNVAELFFARNLDQNDFSDSQKRVMVDVVKNAVKRTGSKKGGIEYVDYGGDIVNKWFGPGGVKTKDMIANTLFANPKFMVATTLGRFSYKIENGKLKITDIYDFKKIPDAKTKAEDLEGLSWPQKVDKIRRENNVNPYVAIRHLGYLENPEDSPQSKPQINIELPITQTA